MNKEIFSSFGGNVANVLTRKVISKSGRQHPVHPLPGILFITSYPPRECGIATYSQDLIGALNDKFSNSFSFQVCALESGNATYIYPEEVKYRLDASNPAKYAELVRAINMDTDIGLVVVQHEFGLFDEAGKDTFLQFLYGLAKPVMLVFHTVLPNPDKLMKENVRHIAAACASIIVMTQNAAAILRDHYGIDQQKIETIAHGTHLVMHLNKAELKEKHGLSGRKVLSTFGLLGPGKGIQTTLAALPAIVEAHPEIIFLILGKTHPGVIKSEGEKYRNLLEAQVDALNLRRHVKFINLYLPLQDLLAYLQLTDVYLFTSKDPNQAVSGTFSYAMSCGCPIISTPIPHALEMLTEDTGILIDFQNAHEQLAEGVNRLMGDEDLRSRLSANALQRIVPTAWENSAIAHALLIRKIIRQTPGEGASAEGTGTAFSRTVSQTKKFSLQYQLPAISLKHVKKMTTGFGMIQFSKINQPDLESGYTLDDNARALIALCMHYEQTRDRSDLSYLRTYFNFIRFCLQPNGYFLNYVDKEQKFTTQNEEVNLADSNGRALWALGYLISKRAILPSGLVAMAENVMQQALHSLEKMYSTRAIAFALKGLYYSNLEKQSPQTSELIEMLANRLVRMYLNESEPEWEWYESYLTYANSILPEALLCAWLETGNAEFKEIAKTSFDFLLSRTFNEAGIKVISNHSWLQKGQEAAPHGEQPIDVAYTILALSRFYDVFKEAGYLNKMSIAFSWFLGNNHLHQIIYNPCTGGCYDGLEATQVNLNQGAESTLSYLMARLTVG